MNEIPYLDDAMWAFDDAGLAYPEVPAVDAPVFAVQGSSGPAVPHDTEMECSTLARIFHNAAKPQPK
jgi:hypothetical protein